MKTSGTMRMCDKRISARGISNKSENKGIAVSGPRPAAFVP